MSPTRDHELSSRDRPIAGSAAPSATPSALQTPDDAAPATAQNIAPEPEPEPEPISKPEPAPAPAQPAPAFGVGDKVLVDGGVDVFTVRWC